LENQIRNLQSKISNPEGAVVQSGERFLCKEEVRGSNPLGSMQLIDLTLKGIHCILAAADEVKETKFMLKQAETTTG
jgi:hypothetical protein